MDTIAENPRAVIGGNAPPLSPFEKAAKRIDDLFAETKLWLDGAVVDSQPLADGIANLMAMLRQAATEADEARIAEKKPLDEQIAEIQTRYAPLIADTKAVKGKTTIAIAACKKALQPWLDKRDAEIREAARIAREQADAAALAAQQALRAAELTDLAAREAAEQLIRDAKRADTQANKAERQTATAGGATGRSATLRSSYIAVMTSDVLASRFYWTEAREEILRVVQSLADRDVRAGKREIPGFEIREVRNAV